MEFYAHSFGLFSTILNTFYCVLASFIGAKKAVVNLTISSLKIITAFCVIRKIIIVCQIISIAEVPVSLILFPIFLLVLTHVVWFTDWMLDFVFEIILIEIIGGLVFLLDHTIYLLKLYSMFQYLIVLLAFQSELSCL